jgi:hypothetical protein
MMDTIVDVYELGTGKKKEYAKSYSGVTAWIVPATNESIALFDNMPQGPAYEFRIIDTEVPNLREQSMLTVTDSQMTGFTEGDIFITIANTRRVCFNSTFYLVGMCYKADK